MKNFSIAGLTFLLFGLAGDVCSTSPDAQEPLLPTVHKAPEIRSSALPPAPVAAISSLMLASLQNLPMVLDATVLESAPRIVAAQERRAYLAEGDKIVVQGELRGASEFRLVRTVRRLLDPVSKDYLGDEVAPVGTATLLERTSDGLHRLLITDASREITTGDRLIALPREASQNIASYRSPQAVDALVVTIADDAGLAMQHQIVAINKGARDHIREGVLLSLSATQTIRQSPQTSSIPTLPEEPRGVLLIVRVYDRVSYGLITQAREPVQVGDKAYAPRQERMSVKDVE